jgi:hypothetical protein
VEVEWRVGEGVCEAVEADVTKEQHHPASSSCTQLPGPNRCGCCRCANACPRQCPLDFCLPRPIPTSRARAVPIRSSSPGPSRDLDCCRAITTCTQLHHTATAKALSHWTVSNNPPFSATHLHSSRTTHDNTAKMSDDEDRVTMPFKFVTGE